MRAALVAAAALVFLATGSVTCGGATTTTPASKCTPGASVVCAGLGGCTGYQVCGATGESLGACMCAGVLAAGGADAGADADAGAGADSGTGTGTGAGADASADADADSAAVGSCKGGRYAGALGGLYSSRLTLIGANIPMTGTVDLTLVTEGTAAMACMLGGVTESCSNVLIVRDGTFTGTADGLFPFFCTLSGALDCKARKLVGGWMECTYCAVGPLNDGGTSCATGGTADGGSIGTGGQFAGPLTADYFYTGTGGDGGAGAIDGGGSGPPAFGTVPRPLGAGNPSDYDPGVWNGAESLAGYSGSGPLPDGGTLGNYLSDAGYGQIGTMNFGGNGWWYATYQPP